MQEANRVKNLEIQQLRKSLVLVRNSLEREKQDLDDTIQKNSSKSQRGINLLKSLVSELPNKLMKLKLRGK